MKVIASVREFDEKDTPLILLGYEIAEDDSGFGTEMYIGVESRDSDDAIFAFVPTETDLLAEIDKKWGNWDTFKRETIDY